MPGAYALGKHAFGFCDRCGFRYPLEELKREVIALHEVSLKVCPECWDPDNPQLQLGRYRAEDPQALRNPRPPLGLIQSRFGGAIQYEFLEDTDGWVGIDEKTTVAWQSASQSIKVTDSDSLDPHGIKLAGLTIDHATYNRVRVLFKLLVAPISSGWSGRMYWNGTTDFKSIPSPNFAGMGDPYHVLVWDMFGDADWIAEINDLQFEFFDSSVKATEYELEYIRVEKAPEDRG